MAGVLRSMSGRITRRTGSRSPGRLLVPMILLGLVASLLAGMPVAQAVPEKVLVLATTVTGGAASEEAQAASALGFGVDIVDASGWAALTAAQFGSYRAIVLGDPTCSTALSDWSAAEANRATWGPQVDGNIIVNGTDPVYHSSQGGLAMTNAGIAFATDSVGRTGLYLSLSCYYHGTAPGTSVPVLDPFGSFTVTGVGCFNDAHIVATHPALSGLTDASLSDWFCSVHEAFDSWPASGPSAFTVLAIAEGAGSTYTAPDGSVGIPYILARGEGLAAGDIALAPVSATNAVGTSHTVEALVSSGGIPQAGLTVTFTIVSGPHAGLTGTATTNASGTATFSYTGTAVGVDTIEASFVDGRGATQTSNQATKTWEEASGSDADLSVTKTDSPDPVRRGRKLTYTITVANLGPSNASNVAMEDTLPRGVRFLSAVTTHGTCSRVARSITCVLGSIADTESATVTVTVRPRKCGPKTNVVRVTASESDPDLTNNSAQAITRVRCRGDDDDDDDRAVAGGRSLTQ